MVVVAVAAMAGPSSGPFISLLLGFAAMYLLSSAGWKAINTRAGKFATSKQSNFPDVWPDPQLLRAGRGKRPLVKPEERGKPPAALPHAQLSTLIPETDTE
ncbi:hypothetical protein E2C01_063134 [Portunus trituberculatus]|uniref:Uncharacterized protein n=1 Tax=Portunus trituberculatus TaxID=210409 RepID=A0A5B7HFJ9_PORTR|nr:hypothetical protein [Portunus trituberculatus]